MKLMLNFCAMGWGKFGYVFLAAIHTAEAVSVIPKFPFAGEGGNCSISMQLTSIILINKWAFIGPRR